MTDAHGRVCWKGEMATAEQLKALVRSHTEHDDAEFRSIAMQIAAHSAKKGNTSLAEELRRLIDQARREQRPVSPPRAVPITKPPSDLVGLVSSSYPTVRLSDMVLDEANMLKLKEIVHQNREREVLHMHALTPKRRLLLVGPPGCGKTMTASALATDCQLPLMFVQLHGLITKYLGETSAKLHQLFLAMTETRAVYLFDEFDAIGSTRTAGNDVGEIRRILNSFLQLLERDESDSIIVAATNFMGMLDEALFRRFDDVIRYELPNATMLRQLIENRLSSYDLSQIKWKIVIKSALGLSHSETCRACDDAARRVVLSKNLEIDSSILIQALRARKQMKPQKSELG
jgi:SpoVK/Ycf46/Vps4 family AAA+-type ATPase